MKPSYSHLHNTSQMHLFMNVWPALCPHPSHPSLAQNKISSSFSCITCLNNSNGIILRNIVIMNSFNLWLTCVNTACIEKYAHISMIFKIISSSPKKIKIHSLSCSISLNVTIMHSLDFDIIFNGKVGLIAPSMTSVSPLYHNMKWYGYASTIPYIPSLEVTL